MAVYYYVDAVTGDVLPYPASQGSAIPTFPIPDGSFEVYAEPPEILLMNWDLVNSIWRWLPPGLSRMAKFRCDDELASIAVAFSGESYPLSTFLADPTWIELFFSASLETNAGIRKITLPEIATPIEKTNEELVAFYHLVSNAKQQILDIYGLVLDGINDSPATITTLPGMNAAWDTFRAGYSNTRTISPTTTSLQSSLTSLADNVYVKSSVDTLLASKVDKITGKGLSQEDFTSALKAKLDGITENATTNNDNVARTLNSNYTIASNVRGVFCSYSINAAWTLQALLTGSGAAFLEYSINSGSSWITVNNVGKGLNLLTFAGSDDMNLSGFIPATATNTRIRTTSTNMTITYTRGQEVLL